MKYAWFLIPIVFASLCISQNTGNANLKDCRDDTRCFYNATQYCEPATLTIQHLKPSTQGGQEVTLYAEVRGVENNKCVIFAKYTNVENVGEVNMTCQSPRMDDNT